MQISNQLIGSLFGDSLTADSSQNRSNTKTGKNAYDFEDVFTNSKNTQQSADAVSPGINYTKSSETAVKSAGKSYADLANEAGLINYNGVVFKYENNTLCLGDVSNKNNVLTIPLSGGECLMVNRNSLDDLAKAIGLFSPQDTKRILDAIAADAKAKSKDAEIKNTISKAYETISEK